MSAGDRSLRDDTRGLAMGIVAFFAMLIVAAVLFIVLDMAFGEMFDFSTQQATHEGARDQQDTARAIWNNIMFVPLFFAVLFLVTRAVREAGRV
ncbi:MAG: hypothetical protein RI560_04780 [Natronomonas sp.]|uniref:hypothetical protein n=1 Tax=Natronomonas sp. TaxID=2184060 RepID=UPI0028700870|nr:hypothetical protein [Natronomonas sp.]MDR9380973.1 hypothetical protein [Natronomonas sp.]MDR9431760.1 hypothetical protein [Natronomonas sp.]